MSVHFDPVAVRLRTLNGVLIACGVVALLLRVEVVGVPTATAIFALILAALAAVSVAAPLPSGGSAPLPVGVVLAFGVIAVAGASAPLAGGAALPHGALALVLGIGAAIAEELFFRRLVYGTLAAWHPIVAVVGSAVLFALIHVPLYGAAVFWVDLGAGLLFSWQRWASGDWRAPAATHAVANILAVVR